MQNFVIGTSDPTAWDSGTTYLVGRLATNGGTIYICTVEHTNQEPPNASYWTACDGRYSSITDLEDNENTTSDALIAHVMDEEFTDCITCDMTGANALVYKPEQWINGDGEIAGGADHLGLWENGGAFLSGSSGSSYTLNSNRDNVTFTGFRMNNAVTNLSAIFSNGWQTGNIYTRNIIQAIASSTTYGIYTAAFSGHYVHANMVSGFVNQLRLLSPGPFASDTCHAAHNTCIGGSGGIVLESNATAAVKFVGNIAVDAATTDIGGATPDVYDRNVSTDDTAASFNATAWDWDTGITGDDIFNNADTGDLRLASDFESYMTNFPDPPTWGAPDVTSFPSWDINGKLWSRYIPGCDDFILDATPPGPGPGGSIIPQVAYYLKMMRNR